MLGGGLIQPFAYRILNVVGLEKVQATRVNGEGGDVGQTGPPGNGWDAPRGLGGLWERTRVDGPQRR